MPLESYTNEELVQELARRGFYSTKIGNDEVKQILLNYMEFASEERFCAGWLVDLETALLGDTGYEALIKQAGGHWIWDDSAKDYRRFVKGWPKRKEK